MSLGYVSPDCPFPPSGTGVGSGVVSGFAAGVVGFSDFGFASLVGDEVDGFVVVGLVSVFISILATSATDALLSWFVDSATPSSFCSVLRTACMFSRGHKEYGELQIAPFSSETILSEEIVPKSMAMPLI